VVVVDRSGRATPAAVAAALGAGVDAFLRTADPDLVVAHLDAVTRRRPR
jgi:hypothetical protein